MRDNTIRNICKVALNCIPITKDGTCSIGLTSLYSLQCCSPPPLMRLTAFMSYGISFKLRAIRTLHEQELRQYEYNTGWNKKIFNTLLGHQVEMFW